MNVNDFCKSTIMKPIVSPVKNYVIPLDRILQNDKKALIIISGELKTRGYTFIRLTPELIEQINICMPIIDKFFSEPVNYKKLYVKPPIFGYFNVQHKESFRLLTGARLSEHKLPYNFDKIKNLVQTLDQLMHSLALICSPVLFPNLMSKAKELNIPLFNMQKQWGMFDIAKYHNTGLRSELNCKEHFDPGLLSLSIRSTEPGLQLKDEFGRWIKVPNDDAIAVLWAGKAANDINSNIKAGIHRVVNNDKPRIGIWYEISTAEQEHLELIKDKKATIAKSIESDSGIPMSKSPGPAFYKSKMEKQKLDRLPAHPYNRLMPLMTH